MPPNNPNDGAQGLREPGWYDPQAIAGRNPFNLQHGRGDQHDMARNVAGNARRDLGIAASNEQRAAEALHGRAGEGGRLAAVQMRSQAMPEQIAQASMGAMAGRQAVGAVGSTGYQAGMEGTAMSAGDRIAASDIVMSAQARQAEYENAQMQAYIARRRSAQHAMNQLRNQELEAGIQQGANIRGVIGTGAGAMGTGISAYQTYGEGQ